MRPWRRGPNRGIRHGLGVQKAAQQADAARARQEAGKVPPPGPATQRAISRRRRNAQVMGGALLRGTNAPPQNPEPNTQG